jgi:hypothetical protein
MASNPESQEEAMSILETFYYLFEADASSIKDGTKEAEKGADKLKKKIDDTDKSANKLGKQFNGLMREAVGWIAGIAAVGSAISRMFSAADVADRLLETSRSLGVQIGEWDAWTRAVKEAGGEAGGLEGSVRSLNAQIVALATTGHSRIKPFLDDLGISIRKSNGELKNGLELIPEIAEELEGMSAAEVQGIGQKLGLDPGTIMLIQQGRKGIDELIRKHKELGTITEANAEIARKFNDSVDDLNSTMTVFFSEIAARVLPALTWLLEGFAQMFAFLNRNQWIIDGFFAAIAIGAAIALPWLLRMAGAVVAATWPWIAIGAAIVAAVAFLGLLIDDIKAFARGAPSLIGLAADKIGDTLLAMKESVVGVFRDLWEFISGIIEKIIGAWDKVKSLMPAFNAGDSLIMAKTGIKVSGSTPIGAQSSSSIMGGATSNNQTTVNVGEVKVQTQATDADGISKAIGNSLNNELTNTSAQYDDGIRG